MRVREKTREKDSTVLQTCIKSQRDGGREREREIDGEREMAHTSFNIEKGCL